jgi:Peptidase family M28
VIAGARLPFWLALAIPAAAAAALLWYMIAMPARSWSGALPSMTGEERGLAEGLREHVQAIASKPHHRWAPAELEAAASYCEDRLRAAGYVVQREEFKAAGAVVRNLIVEVRGIRQADEIVLVGAHYDSVPGAPGANDNGSGAAAVLELARAFRGWRPARTWRLALFVNEEPPFFRTTEMGSAVHARNARQRGERVVAMYSIETIGFYSDAPGSQHYPFPFNSFYPDQGNFLGFVGNLASRSLVHQTIATFRAQAQFPSEGIAAPAWVPGVDWSDQMWFWHEGYAAVMITDTALFRYPHYHTAQDTPDKVDYARLARVVRALERTFRVLDGTTLD